MKTVISFTLVLGLGLTMGAAKAVNNQVPIADAGSSRYAGPDPVFLDGTGSYDPDESGTLSYEWRQIDGPEVFIVDSDTATPSIGQSLQTSKGRNPRPIAGDFIQTDEIQECMFELIVSDGELTSLPDTVKVIIVPDFGVDTLLLENPPFDSKRPTFIYFGGGDCVSGSGSWLNMAWLEKANVISFKTYSPDSDGSRTYYRYGDMLIAYLSSVAPDYKQPIQTSGWSTGGQPAIDIGLRLNLTYRDPRFAVNHVTFLDATIYCRNNYPDNIATFLGSSVEGEQCWVDNYVSTETSYPPFQNSTLNITTQVTDHSFTPGWYRSSLFSEDANKFNGGLVAGAYWSVVGPGKNLQLAWTPGISVYGFKWYGSLRSGYMDYYDKATYPAKLPEPVTLVGPEDGAFVDANGAILSCEESENAIGYQLLFGSEPYRVMDYTIISDTPEPPSELITSFPFEQTFWTVRVYDEYGSTIYADPICIYPEIVEDSSKTLVAHWKLDETEGDIAYDSVGDNDATVHNGAWTTGKVDGSLDFNGLNTYVDCGDSEQLGPEQMTISMWLKPEHMGGMRYIAARSDPNTYEIDYAITRQNTGELEFIIGQIDSDPVSVTSIGITPMNEWTDLVVTLDGSVASIYINGQSDNSAVYSQRIVNAGYQLIISSLGADTRFYHGLIDDVRIYNQAIKP